MTPPTMKAVRLHEFGAPDVLRYEDVPTPHPGTGEVLVRVHAVGLNPPDWYAREGMPDVPPELKPPFHLPMVPGTDVSGTVAAVGDGVDEALLGRDVIGLLDFPGRLQAGAYAQYVVARPEDLASKPPSITHEEAAALPMSLLTAWQFLVALGHDHPSPFQEAPHVPKDIGEGSTVLVNGAAGGVGHFAVQIAKARGARVVAVASGRHEEFLRGLGADAVVDYTRERPEEVVRGVDVVLDCVGGPDSRRLLATLAPGGHLYPVYFGDFDEEENARLGVTVTATQVRSNGAQLAEVAALVEEGTLRVELDGVHPLADAAAAHERAAAGHIRGKIVLSVA